MARIKMHIPKAKLPFYPPCEVKCRLQNGVSTVSNYMLLPQRTREERLHMARLFLLHLLGAYLFANGGKMVSLRWLTLFRTLKRHKEPIRGKHVLPIFTPPSTLSTGAPCNSLWGLRSFLRLGLFPFLAFSFVACSLANCIVLHIANYHLASNL